MQLNKQKLKEITKKIKLDESRKRNALTIKVHEYHWHKNLLRNAKQKVFKTAKTINHLVNEIGFGKRIWVCGAGYSLEEKKNYLKENFNPATDVIFATDASLRFLINEVVILPDYVFILDSKKEGLRFFKDVDLSKIKMVVSSAIDKEFLPLVEKAKSVYGFHMYDPSMPDWGGDSETVAHKLLPNLQYIVNKGNVFNLCLLVAIQAQPSELFLIGSEYCYKIDKDGNVKTRANVKEDFDYSVGSNFCRMDKIILVEKNGKFYMTQKDYYGYALITNEILKMFKCKLNNLSGGLLL